MDSKFDQRKNKRLQYEALIWHDNLVPEIFYNAKMYNLSKKGVYFESDQVIYPGEDIFIGLKDPAKPINDTKNRIHVEIKWRKDLQNTSFRFGYGAKLIHPIETLTKSIDKTKLRHPSSQGKVITRKEDPRKHLRKPYRQVIVFSSKGKNYKGFITNISRGGAFIMTKNKFYVGQLIQIVISGDKKKNDVKLKGWVVRLCPEGAGVRFDRRRGRDRRRGLDRRANLKSATSIRAGGMRKAP